MEKTKKKEIGKNFSFLVNMKEHMEKTKKKKKLKKCAHFYKNKK